MMYFKCHCASLLLTINLLLKTVAMYLSFYEKQILYFHYNDEMYYIGIKRKLFINIMFHNYYTVDQNTKYVQIIQEIKYIEDFL